MPNDIANNMTDTIHLLEEDNASLLESLTNLQLAYNEQMIELEKAKRLLKQAMEDMKTIYEANKDEGCYGIDFKWRYADEVMKILKEE